MQNLSQHSLKASLKPTKIRKIIKNQKGQMAIFMVLIFQVLFILFALSLNVAMVVHDKINLQNSLDLASYYGAAKQAEVLNAMAHINYQMRQNWKLLAWRYRILGTMLQYHGHYNNTSPQAYWCPQNRYRKTHCSVNDPEPRVASACSVSKYPDPYCDSKYFICINHQLWKRGIEKTQDQNMCTKKVDGNIVITKMDDSLKTSPFPESIRASEATYNIIQKAGQSCPLEGSLNWLMAQLFLTHFRLDQADRKTMIKEIYKKTLKEGRDLEGQSIHETVKKVFKKNLTQSNFASFKDDNMKTENSFEGKNWTDFFEEVPVFPILRFFHPKEKNEPGQMNCGQAIGEHFLSKSTGSNFYNFWEHITQSSQHQHPLKKFFGQHRKHWEELFAFNKGFFTADDDPRKKLTLSFYKKPDKILYYGLKVEFDYKNTIFFLPTTGIKFKASAFAKAFGGNFGPPAGRDPLILNKLPQALSPKWVYALQPNYSRWPGDKWGLIDYRLHKGKMAFLNKHKYYPNTKRVYTIEDYLFLDQRDPLAYNKSLKEAFSFVRMMELMAIYPDLYDITHYSISASYHYTHFKKICKLFTGSDCDLKNMKKLPKTKDDFYLRTDLGWPFLEEYNQIHDNIDISLAPTFLDNSSPDPTFQGIKDFTGAHIPKDKGPDSGKYLKHPKWNTLNPPQETKLQKKAILVEDKDNYYRDNKPPPNYRPTLTRGKLFYPWSGHPLNAILSSWSPPHTQNQPLNYKTFIDEKNPVPKHFLSCSNNPDPNSGTNMKGKPIPSACVGMGRTGYSVKMVSCKRVKTFKPKLKGDIDDWCGTK